jgi:hypothetical protein
MVAAAPGNLLRKINAPSPIQGGDFGRSVAAVGSHILIAEPNRVDINTGARGTAYLCDSQSGLLTYRLDNPEPMDQDGFASALTGGDGMAFISTSGTMDRIYAFNINTGLLERRIDDPDGRNNSFGTALSFAAGTLVASSPSYTLSGGLLSAGRANAFDGTNGSRQYAINNPEPKTFDGFGSGATSVAVSSNSIIVGAILDDLPNDNSPDGDNPGRVWVFNRATGEVKFPIENPNPASQLFDWFGFSVAADNSSIVVGAREDGTSGVDGSGTAYIFDSSNGALLHTLFSPQPEANGEFGRSVAMMANGNVVVGAWGTSVDGIEGAGRVYLFDGRTGSLLYDIPNPEPSAFGAFGYSVAAVGNTIAIGAPGGAANALPSTGAVYLFSTVPEPAGIVVLEQFVVLLAVLSRRDRKERVV